MDDQMFLARVARYGPLIAAFGLAVLFGTMADAAVAGSATFTVNTTADSLDANPGDGACADTDGKCSLRAAIMESNQTGGPDVVDVPSGRYHLTLATSPREGGSGALSVSDDLTIRGAGAETTVVDALGLDRAFGIDTSSTGFLIDISLDLRDLAITHASAFVGGAVVVLERAHLTLDRVVISDSGSSIGGGVYSNGGDVLIRDSTFTGNDAESGGAVANRYGTMTMINSTISGNQGGEGAVYNESGSLTLTNVTIANNTSPNLHVSGISSWFGGSVTIANSIVSAAGGSACSAGITSLGHNIDTDGTCGLTGAGDLQSADPMLGPLSWSIGLTPTQALLPGSVAIDAGDPSRCPPTDQRGVGRPKGAACDMGAYEFDPGIRIWGDFDCNGSLTIGDAQKIARDLIGLAITQEAGCPEPGQEVMVDGTARDWGDLDCQNGLGIGDAQKTARKLINLSVGQAAGCPLPGDEVQVAT